MVPNNFAENKNLEYIMSVYEIYDKSVKKQKKILNIKKTKYCLLLR